MLSESRLLRKSTALESDLLYTCVETTHGDAPIGTADSLIIKLLHTCRHLFSLGNGAAIT